MLIAFTCPYCGHRGQAPDNANGHNVRCSRCGKPFKVRVRIAPTAQVGVACPGCGRKITLASHELSILIECAGCSTRFVPSQLGQADAPQAPAPAEPSPNRAVNPSEDLEEDDLEEVVEVDDLEEVGDDDAPRKKSRSGVPMGLLGGFFDWLESIRQKRGDQGSPDQGSPQYVTVGFFGNIQVRASNAAEAKLAIKQLRLLRKTLVTRKRMATQQQQAIRAKYTDYVRRRGSKVQGRDALAKWFRSVESMDRDQKRRNLARELAPPERDK
jgi:DNA-directed RNA polymerase subunit RPC12/RpoP